VFVFVWVCLKGQEVMSMVTGNLLIDRAGLAIYQHQREGETTTTRLFSLIARSLGSNPGHASRHYVIDSATRSKQQQQARRVEGERGAIC
jgi:hypothetical protein